MHFFFLSPLTLYWNDNTVPIDFYLRAHRRNFSEVGQGSIEFIYNVHSNRQTVLSDCFYELVSGKLSEWTLCIEGRQNKKWQDFVSLGCSDWRRVHDIGQCQTDVLPCLKVFQPLYINVVTKKRNTVEKQNLIDAKLNCVSYFTTLLIMLNVL